MRPIIPEAIKIKTQLLRTVNMLLESSAGVPGLFTVFQSARREDNDPMPKNESIFTGKLS